MEEYYIGLVPITLDKQGNIVPPKPPGPFGAATLSDDVCYGRRTCASCSTPDCTTWCSGCDVTEVGKIRTFYCNSDCQRKHRKSHKVDCAARRNIARLVSILHPLYIAFEKATHVRGVDKVSVKEELLTIGRQNDLRAYTGASMFLQFPEQTCPAGTPKDVLDSILLDQACAEGLTTALPLLNYLIKPFCRRLDIATAKPKNPARLVYSYNIATKQGEGGTGTFHNVLRIHAGRSELYALDLSGAQHGYTEVLSPWSAFTQHRFARDIDLGALEGILVQERMALNMFPPQSLPRVQNTLRCRVMEAFVADCKGLLPDESGATIRGETPSIHELLAQDKAAFLETRQRFLDCATSYPRELVKALHQQDVGRMYMSRHFVEQVTLTSEEAVRYKKVWLKKDDERVTSKNVKALKTIWKKRLNKCLPAGAQ